MAFSFCVDRFGGPPQLTLDMIVSQSQDTEPVGFTLDRRGTTIFLYIYSTLGIKYLWTGNTTSQYS